MMDNQTEFLEIINLKSMSPQFYHEKSLMNEWQDFIRYKKVSPNISKTVLESWERSLLSNVDPYGGKSTDVLPPHKLRERLEKNRELLDIIMPVFEQVYLNIQGLGYLLFLTDRDAYLLYLIGDKNVEQDFSNALNFYSGASWSEQAVGTTAVSRAINEQCAIEFMSQEKYCFELKKKACSAIPIKNIDGEIIGIMGIAANFPQIDSRIFNILLAAQIAVENQLRMLKISRNLKVVTNYYKRIFNLVSDAIVAVDREGIIKDINSQALNLLNERAYSVIGKNIRHIIDFYPVLIDELKQGGDDNKSFITDTSHSAFKYNPNNEVPILSGLQMPDTMVNILRISEKKRAKNVKSAEVLAKAKYQFDDLIGESDEFLNVKKMAERASKSNANILITGKSGTGKEMMAQAIHLNSHRAAGKFVAVNCGAIPKDLIESEFFGYEDGAFTGSLKGGKPGKFEQASGGTVFLDEIAEMPYNIQVTLLRVLQEKEIYRIGGNTPVRINVRVIAATNRDIELEIKNGNFRNDLYWRLNVVNITMPELNNRKKCIPLLARHFISKYKDITQRNIEIANETMNLLQQYSWPGNVRELENVIERAMIFVEGNVIMPEHLPDQIKEGIDDKVIITQCSSIPSLEKEIIRQSLNKYKWNISKCSGELEISRNTLYSKIEKYNLTR